MSLSTQLPLAAPERDVDWQKKISDNYRMREDTEPGLFGYFENETRIDPRMVQER